LGEELVDVVLAVADRELAREGAHERLSVELELAALRVRERLRVEHAEVRLDEVIGRLREVEVELRGPVDVLLRDGGAEVVLLLELLRARLARGDLLLERLRVLPRGLVRAHLLVALEHAREERSNLVRRDVLLRLRIPRGRELLQEGFHEED